MGKLKSNRGAAKRFIKTKGGLKRRAANRNHILTKKAQARKRSLRAPGKFVGKADKKSVLRLLNER